MDVGLYIEGLPLIASWEVLLFLVIGTVAGIVIGALPGLSPTMAIAILSPITFSMDLLPALAMLLGIYCGGMYGGSIGAILLNIPGHAGSVMTAIEGYQMHRRGETSRALKLAISASFLGGIFSVAVLSVLAPLLAGFALEFSFQEYFSIALFGLLLISFVQQGNTIKALISGLVGIMLSFIGTDPLMGFGRFTFGNLQLEAKLSLVAVFVGLFGLSELFLTVLKPPPKPGGSDAIKQVRLFSLGEIGELLKDLKTSIGTLIRGSMIGTIIGAAPGTGGTIGSIVAYGVERSVSKHPEKFGTGHRDGLAAAESSNNATTGGAMIPMLTLGIPGDAVTAILIGTFMIHGVIPGPLLFIEQKGTVSAIFLLLVMANLLFLVIGMLWSFSLAKMMGKMSRQLIVAVIMALCVVGTYSVRTNVFDVYLMIAFGILGVLMSIFGFARAPLILGFILGPLVEDNFRRAMILSDGNYATFITNPISGTFLGACVLLLVSPLITRAIRSRKMKKVQS